MTLSIVVPVHNEAEHIRESMGAFIGGLDGDLRDEVVEILLIENGSTDDTYDRCLELVSHLPKVRVLRLEEAGYGGALVAGILAARGSYVAVLESDVLDHGFLRCAQTCIRRTRARFIVGSKRHPDSRDERPLSRRVLTYLFNRILNVFIGYPGTDTHGLKCMERELAVRLARESRTSSEVLQTELVVVAWRTGMDIHEVPLRIAEKRATPVSIGRRMRKVRNLVRELRTVLASYREGAPGRIVTWHGDGGESPR